MAKKRLFNRNDLSRIANVSEEDKKACLRQARERLLKAWDIHKGNAYYGIDEHTEEQKEICVKWYNALCDLEDWAFEDSNIPECVKKYLK